MSATGLLLGDSRERTSKQMYKSATVLIDGGSNNDTGIDIIQVYHGSKLIRTIDLPTSGTWIGSVEIERAKSNSKIKIRVLSKDKNKWTKTNDPGAFEVKVRILRN